MSVCTRIKNAVKLYYYIRAESCGKNKQKDHTMCQVKLNAHLLPADSSTIEMETRTKNRDTHPGAVIPKQVRRSRAQIDADNAKRDEEKNALAKKTNRQRCGTSEAGEEHQKEVEGCKG